jgi:hypothetical protein
VVAAKDAVAIKGDLSCCGVEDPAVVYPWDPRGFGNIGLIANHSLSVSS